jgi:Raf kinase inhibitor-like YbhB/YbcL family protein
MIKQIRHSILALICTIAPCLTAYHAYALDLTVNLPKNAFSLREVYSGFGCTGENISPEITWRDLPEGTKSVALTVYDPDAPTGSGWWHWLVYNIPVTASSLPAGLPNTRYTQSRTDYGVTGYGGPCPPEGDKPHRYIFTLFALNSEKLDLPAESMPALVGFFLNKHKIAIAQKTYNYGR